MKSKTYLFNYKGNGNSAYIAYNGKVYEVSGSFLWKNGEHQVTHSWRRP